MGVSFQNDPWLCFITTYRCQMFGIFSVMFLKNIFLDSELISATVFQPTDPQSQKEKKKQMEKSVPSELMHEYDREASFL